jgi:hypothetical protein
VGERIGDAKSGISVRTAKILEFVVNFTIVAKPLSEA